MRPVVGLELPIHDREGLYNTSGHGYDRWTLYRVFPVDQ